MLEEKPTQELQEPKTNIIWELIKLFFWMAISLTIILSILGFIGSITFGTNDRINIKKYNDELNNKKYIVIEINN